MAEFKAGDRVVKMSGIGAGKYGTVNSVMENGTLNVTFDGERLPKYCDPALCGQVAANAKFKVGDRVKDKHGNRGIVVGIQDDDAGPFGPLPSKHGAILRIKTDDGKTGYLEEANASLANSCAANSAAADKGRKLLSGTRGEGYVATMEKELAAGKSEGLKHDIRVASHYAEHGTPEGKEFHKAVLVYLKELGRKYGINSAAANAVSNASYRNSHSYFVIAPGIKDHCILSGWDNREDAEYAAADLRKRGVACSVARRQILEMSGVDPDVEKSWKSNHVPNACAANAVAQNANGWPNARMKFKAGDKVRHKTNGLDGVVEGWASDPGQYRVRASGRVYEWDEDDLVLARNAVARNGRLASMLDSAIAKMNEAEKHKDDPGKVQVAARATEKLVDGVIDGIDAFERTDVDAWHDMYDWLDKSAKALSDLAFWPVNIGNRVKTTIRYLGAARRMVAKYSA